MAEHPEISKVNVEILTWSDGISKLDTAVAANAAPDICYLDQSFLAKYVAQDMVIPIEDYLEEGDKEDFYEFAVDFVSYDGKMMGFPLFSTARVLWANKTLLEEMGLADQLPLDGDRSWTFDEFNEIVKQFPYEKDGRKIYAFELLTAGGAESNLLWMWNRGAELYNADETAFALNSEEGLESVQYLVDLLNAEHIRYVPEGATASNFWAGEVAFKDDNGYTVAGASDKIAEATPEGQEAPEMVALQFPTTENVAGAATYGGLGGLNVFSQKDDSDARIAAAAGFAHYLTNTENMQAVANAAVLPVRYSCGNIYGDDENAAVATSLAPNGKHLGLSEAAQQIYTNVFTPEMDAIFVGAKTPEEGLADMEEQANDMLSR